MPPPSSCPLFTRYSIVSVIASIFASVIGPPSCPSLVRRCTMHCCHVHRACIVAPVVCTSSHPSCVRHHVHRRARRTPSPAVGELSCLRWCTIMSALMWHRVRVGVASWPTLVWRRVCIGASSECVIGPPSHLLLVRCRVCVGPLSGPRWSTVMSAVASIVTFIVRHVMPIMHPPWCPSLHLSWRFPWFVVVSIMGLSPQQPWIHRRLVHQQARLSCSEQRRDMSM
jgi:hypothetical protein